MRDGRLTVVVRVHERRLARTPRRMGYRILADCDRVARVELVDVTL